MAGDQHIFISDPSGPGMAVIAENGPMRLAIRAWSEGAFFTDAALEGAGFAFSCLRQVAAHLSLLKIPGAVPESVPLPAAPVALAMIQSIRRTRDPDLTPMAAVAGSIADAVADRIRRAGAQKVIVENGGDIAIRLDPGQTARVGLRTGLDTPGISRIMALDADHTSWGVNTSGLGGRSLTCGIASAATAVAVTSSLADAAATSIANACFHPHPDILRVPARDMDPHTDIPDVPVTAEIKAPLPGGVIRAALDRSLERAEAFCARGLILGAVIVCGGHMAVTREFETRVALLHA